MDFKYYYLTQTAHESLGWLGGNAPAWFDDKKEMVEGDNNHYGFYCTLAIDDVQSLSVFIPESFKELLDRNIYPNCSIKSFIHPTTAESANTFFRLMPERPSSKEKLTAYQKRFDYTIPVLNKVYLSHCPTDENEKSAFITIGADIFYIQDKNFYRQKLEQDGYHIWGCINEDGYYPLCRTVDFIHGNMPLNFGAIYLYKKDDSIVAGYWQTS